MAISEKGSVAGRKQFVEQVAEPGLKDLDLGLGERHLLRPVFGHGPLTMFLLCGAAPLPSWWPQMIVEVIGQRTQWPRSSWSRFFMMSHGCPAAGKLHRENGANLSAESFR